MATSVIKGTGWRKIGGPYTCSALNENLDKNLYIDTSEFEELAIITECGIAVFPVSAEINGKPVNVFQNYNSNYCGEMHIICSTFSDHFAFRFRLRSIGAQDSVTSRGKVNAILAR